MCQNPDDPNSLITVYSRKILQVVKSAKDLTKLLIPETIKNEWHEDIAEHKAKQAKLLDNGFVMKQFSVYIKPVKSLSVGQTTTKKLSKFIPDNSSVSFIYITDKQYLMTENYLGKNFEENEESIREKNGQLLLF